MELLSVIRRWHYRDRFSIREISRRTGLSRNTVRKYLRSDSVEPKFRVPDRPSKLDPYADKLSHMLRQETGKARKQKRTIKQLYVDLISLGYDGSYNRVAAFARDWKAARQRELKTCGRGAFVPLAFRPGEAFQFDWSEDWAFDLPAITAGANALAPGATHIYLGTSSWLLCVIEADETIDSPLRVTLDRRYDGALFCLQSGCLAFDWIVDQVYGPERARRTDGFLEFVDAQVAEIAPGSDNLLATHWLTGELPPFSKNAKGVYLNLTTLHDRRHMVHAMMESICYSHRMSIEWFESQGRRRLDEIRVVGGGASSRVWMQMLSDVVNRTVVVPDAPRGSRSRVRFR